MNENFAIQLFEGKKAAIKREQSHACMSSAEREQARLKDKVRFVWDAEQEKYYFAVADIVQVLTDSTDVKQYIKRMRARDPELNSKWGTICTPVEMLAPDGKRRKAQAADLEGIFRLIQSIPSKKAEPVKKWLAEVGAQRIDQMIDPELTFQMAVEDYRRQGYSDRWINERMRSIEMRKELTDEWHRSGRFALKRTIIIALLAVLTLTASSQCTSTTAESTPGWLWEIGGNGLQQKSYLFGTCHGGGHSFTHEEVFGFNGVDKVLSNVNTVYFETDLTVSNRLAAKEMSIAEYLGCPNDATENDLMPEGTTYESLFDSVAQYQEVHQFLTRKMGDTEYWKKTPLYWFNHISGYNLAKWYYGIQAVEGVLSTEAVNRGIEIGQLETTEQHAQWSGRPRTQRQRPVISLKFQATMLYMGIHNDDDQVPEPVRQIATAYLKNDTCSVHNVLESLKKNSTFNKDALPISAMNNAWFPVIEQNIAKGACMVAVGARHLLGNDGLIAMLRRKGYTVEAVK